MNHALPALARQLADGTITSRQLVETCLDAIGKSDGEGSRAFRTVNSESAIATADAIDNQRAAGKTLPTYAGVPISIKDLFDVAGEQTLAGSTVLADQKAATHDAPAVAALRNAGFVFLGRTNMTEFAYSGLGLNPHYGTPLNPYDRASARIPGGSSSGAAVSVSDGMSVAALGTDTGGSCRIPAAFSGIVGFKPTQRRVSLDGITPLSFSLDSVGPLANSVSCCAAIDAVLAGDNGASDTQPVTVDTLRIGVLRNFVFEGIDDVVANTIDDALGTIAAAGASVTDIEIPSLQDIPAINSKGGFAAAEAYAWHRELLDKRGEEYDPRVRVRIDKGREQSAADYIDLLGHREHLIAEAADIADEYDVVVYPTVPVVAPSIESLAADDEYARLNLLALRNPTVTNLLDRCAISIPVHGNGAAPVGLNLMAPAMQDRHLLAVAAAVEVLFGGQ